MSGPTPRLEIWPDRLAGNARAVVDQCRAHGVEVAVVTKVMLAHPALLSAIADSGATMVADSRIANLRRIAEFGLKLPRLLLRAPTPTTADDTVTWADYSLNSSVATVTALSAAAQRAGRTHKVIVMVDVGDLREGVWADRAVATITDMVGLPNIDVVGLGTNLACYGGVLPTSDTMRLLADLRDEAQAATGLPLNLLSGGNSANLPLLASGALPSAINHLRIGEAIVLGRETIDRTPWPGTRTDTVRLVAEVIECETKPSVPVGAIGQDAFGNTPQFVDRGLRRRAICNMGRQDVDPAAITPVDPTIDVVGASSDHLICDVTDADGIDVGSEIKFWPTYAGLLQASTSPFVYTTIQPT